jgi:thiol-disulfide isomerase/thioredoxin
MSKKPIVGLVYASWCGHCQQLKPEWEKMKTLMKPISKQKIIEIEESGLETFKKENPSLSLEINGYPTIFKIHPSGNIEYFDGERNALQLKKWAIMTTPKHITFRKKNGGGRNKRRGTRKYRKSVKRQQK